jgi:hypothetical protein
MTLKELATQLNRPVGEVIKVLSRNGFKGIFKTTHTIPPEAVEIVTNDINNAGLTLPSANPDTAPAPQSEPAIARTEPNMINNIAEATKATQQKVSRDAVQQAIADFSELGAITAINANLAFKKSYAETLEALSIMDSLSQQALITEIQKEFMENQIAFFAESTAETYHQSQQRTVRDTATNTQQLINKLSW